MPAKCILCYITDRSAFSGDEGSRRRHLLEKIREATRAGVDYIQLREKDLSTRELESLARDAMAAIRECSELRTENRERRTALLINSRTDVALAVQADGVHLRSVDISPRDARAVWKCGAGAPRPRSLTTRSADRSFLSLARRGSRSCGQRRYLRRLRPRLRKKRRVFRRPRPFCTRHAARTSRYWPWEGSRSRMPIPVSPQEPRGLPPSASSRTMTLPQS